METPPPYHTPAPPAAPPALLPAARLAELAATVADERATHAGEPVTAMGYWPCAVASLLAHAAALTMRADSADWAAVDVLAERRLLAVAVEVLTARALTAEHQLAERGYMTPTAELVGLRQDVLRLKAEISEQEVNKLDLILENVRQRGALERAEARLLESGEAVGRYEGNGALVYDDDDYVTDAEGCYLTQAQAGQCRQEGGKNDA